MTILVKEIASGAPYVMVGTGFGAYASVTGHALLGALAPDEQSGSYSMVAVAGANGVIGWFPSDQLVVSTIDEVAPRDILGGRACDCVVARAAHSGQSYVLLGAGFAAFATAAPKVFFGNLDPQRRSGTYSLVAVCDANGSIGWLPFDQLVVVAVNGKTPDVAVRTGGYRD